MSNLIGTVSPLVHDRDGIEAGLVFAEAGVPVCYVTMPNLGTTAPATKAGAFVVGAAEIVAAAVLHELAAPGSPVLGSIMQIYADPRTALTMTTRSTTAAVSSRPSCCTPSACRRSARWAAPTPQHAGSWLAGVETMLQLLQVPLDGCELYTGIGLTNTYKLFIPENLILDDDLYHRARYAFLDIPMDEDALALDVDRRRRAGRPLPGAAAHARAHARRRGARREPADRRRRPALPRPVRGGARARAGHPRATTGRSRWPRRKGRSFGGSSTRTECGDRAGADRERAGAL